MKVALVVPPSPLSKFTWTETYHYPLGVLYLASYLAKNGFQVKVVDAIAENMTFNQCVGSFKDCDVVGASAVTSTFNQASNILRTAKTLGKTTVIGGVHVTSLAREVMETNPWIDYGVIGEGEHTLLELVKYLSSGENHPSMLAIKGLVFRNNGMVQFSGERELIQNIDELPYPALGLIDFPSKKYSVSALYAKRSPCGNIITSRGCPYDCLYCASCTMWRRTVRYRSPENVIGEMQVLFDLGVKELKIWDDTFTLNKERVVKICQMMTDEGFDFTWSCLTRVDHLELEMLKEMKNAGCWLVDFGIDAGTQEGLDILRKHVTLQQNIDGVKLVKKAGIEAKGNVILGTPGDTVESIRATIDHTKQLDLDYLNICTMTPIPGSDLYEMALKNGWIVDWNWDNYSGRYPVMNIGTVDYDLLYDLQRQALKEFYSRPSFIFKRLKRLRSYGEFKRAFHAALKVWRGDLD